MLAALSVALVTGTVVMPRLTAGVGADVGARADHPEPPTGVAVLGRAPAAASPSPSPSTFRSPKPSPPPSRTPSPPPPPAPVTRPSPPAEQVDEITALEDEVVTLTNAERRAAGCGEVDTDERLRDAARGHSRDMATNDYFSHTGLDGSSFVERAARAGFPAGRAAGENIAVGYRTPADVMDGWMNSEGHRDNILNCSHAVIGVGLAYDGQGRPYWTQVFGRA